MKKSPQLYLLDGSSYIYRAYYGIRDLATSVGMPTNAVFGFTKMLLSLLQEYRPDYLAVVFDRPREETFRREIYPEYKANRDAMPEDLIPQVPFIKKVLQALSIPAMEAPGFEADDVIATLARRYAAEGIQVTVVTGDKDLMQIVGDGIRLLDTMKNVCLGPQDVLNRFGVPPELVPDVLGLAGDTADNIPGVPGIGEKTAADLVQQFGSLEGVLRWKSLVNGKKRRENLQAYQDQARLSKTLATVRYDVALDLSLADLLRQRPNLSELTPLLRELEFEALEVAFTPPAPGVVEIHCDGSGRVSGPGGYGVILRYGEHEKELSGFVTEATSQRMELLAAIRGLEALQTPKTVRVFSDSQYLVRGMSQWVHGWIRKGRLETPNALPNQDLWSQLVSLARKHTITWEWLPGHAGHHFNERCDKLAKRAAEDGIRAVEAARQSDQTKSEEERIPVPAAPALKMPLPPREIREFEAEEDGQLRLY
ncbi:MAG: ribonuclease HI [Deltaproteobacteria bacterium]|nr:ribonuclease HI [Deltaproteobacteria bacterium]